MNYFKRNQIEIDCSNIIGSLKHIWTSIGFDEINWSYTERGTKLLQTFKSIIHLTKRIFI